MSNLIDQYGTSWFREKFKGSFFMYEGMPACLENTGDKLQSVRVMPRGRDAKNIKVSKEYFVSSEMFCVPELGYRHFDNGNYLMYLSRNNRSYKRGLSVGNMNLDKADITQQLENSKTIPLFIRNPDLLCRKALQPDFIPLHKGIALMLKGKMVSFAASPTVAVVPHATTENLLLLVAGREVGFVYPDGTLSYNINYGSNYLEALQ